MDTHDKDMNPMTVIFTAAVVIGAFFILLTSIGAFLNIFN
jgi:hypothetical protein